MTHAVALTGSDQLVSASRIDYRGFSIAETSGSAAASVIIYDGTSATGTALDRITLLPGESTREWYNGGIEAMLGIYVDVVSGAVAGSVRVG